MFETLSQRRSRGISVDTAAYYTFKEIPGGVPAADSCAGFFVDCPGSHALLHGLKELNDDDGGASCRRDSPKGTTPS